MRIQKYISETGYCSRRETNRLIEAGRVTINGEACGKAGRVSPGDIVLIDNKPIPKKEKPIYIALNKPVGITTTAGKHIEGNIIDFVNHPNRIFPVGRLDKASEGLILLTNDGEIVNKILRHENNHEKEYIVTVHKPFSDFLLKELSAGVNILGGKTNPCEVYRVDESTFGIILTQGLNRQIRRMCKAFDFKVTKLKRIRIMNIKLDDLETGQWRNLTEKELWELFSMLG